MVLKSVPRVRIGNGVQTNFPVSLQIDRLRQLHVITSYYVIGIHIRGCIAWQREIEMRSAHVERLIRITRKQQIHEIKFISQAGTHELNLLG